MAKKIQDRRGMLENRSPTIRSLLLGGVAAMLIAALYVFSPELINRIGSAFLIVPDKLGLLQVVQPEEMQTIIFDSPSDEFSFTEAGDYILYTDYRALVSDEGFPIKIQFTVTPLEGQPTVRVRLGSRGLRPYDTYQAGDLPAAFFHISAPGLYQLDHSVLNVTPEVNIVPDYLSGNEGQIWLLYAIQVAIIVIPLWARYYFKNRTLWTGIKQEKNDKRDEMEDFMKNLR